MPGFIPVTNPTFVGREYYQDDEVVEDQLFGFGFTVRRASELFDGNNGLACCDWLGQQPQNPEEALIAKEEGEGYKSPFAQDEDELEFTPDPDCEVYSQVNVPADNLQPEVEEVWQKCNIYRSWNHRGFDTRRPWKLRRNGRWLGNKNSVSVLDDFAEKKLRCTAVDISNGNGYYCRFCVGR